LAALAACHGACLAVIPRSTRYNGAAYTREYEGLHLVLLAMKKILIAVLVFCKPASALAVEEDFCAKVTSAPKDGLVYMRQGPGAEFPIGAPLVLNDFLYADTSMCSIWNNNICTTTWTHVYSVHRIDGAPRDNLHGFTIGWVYTSYIKSVSCDLDWGYVDPDPPKMDPP
jgi:hypothetical protein